MERFNFFVKIFTRVYVPELVTTGKFYIKKFLWQNLVIEFYIQKIKPTYDERENIGEYEGVHNFAAKI